MAFPIRPLAIALSVVGSFAVVSAAYPSLVEDIGADFWNVNHYQDQCDQSSQSSRECERNSPIVMKRIELKREAIENLLNGRSSFEETVQSFVAINRDFRTAKDYLQQLPGSTMDDRTAWQVVGYLKACHTDVADTIAADWHPVLSARLAAPQ